MKYTTPYGDLDFWDPYPELENLKKIGLNLSGGADSAILLFMTCRELVNKPDHVIIPITGIDDLRPTNIMNASEIVSFFKEMFPTVRFGKHDSYHYVADTSENKRIAHIGAEKRLIESGTVDVLFAGRTANPPYDELVKHDMIENREMIRDPDITENKDVFLAAGQYKYYTPFQFHDKRFIASIYEQYGLLDELFPITASCTAFSEHTKGFTEPCKFCWWCKEKYWAFGMYDGGVKD